MNKVDWTHPGGFPELLNDLEFEQAAVREAFYGLLSAFGIDPPDSFVLSGCNLSSGTYQPGWISLNGEILRFDGQVAPLAFAPDVVVFDVNQSHDSDGQKTMESTAIAQAYVVRTAKIIVVDLSVAPNYLPADSPPRIKDKLVSLVVQDNPTTELANKILAVIAASSLYSTVAQPAMITVGSGGTAPAYTASFAQMSADHPLRFFKDTVKKVVIQGHCVSLITGAGFKVFTLPAAYVPTVDELLHFAVVDVTAGSLAVAYIDKADGGLYIKNTIAGHIYSIGSIQFLP